MGFITTQHEKGKNMTFFKQIAILLSLFLMIILSTVLILNFQSASKGIQDRLYEDAKNTASSLSLSLGSANGDISMMSTMINANFDSGVYKQIRLLDVDDVVLYERQAEREIVEVPSWFLNSVKITAPVAHANVSAGWSQVGILDVQSDVIFAYNLLYTNLIGLLTMFGIIAIVGLIVLYIILHAVLKPLVGVQKQAEAVILNKFIIQENIPYTKEFKDVVLGMNNMVSKVKVMFEKGNEELRRQKELEYIDKATKLKNRKYLIDKLPEYLKVDASSSGGTNILIGLSGIIEANERIGRVKVNDFFIDLAKVFSTYQDRFKNQIISRMNGTEFCIFTPDSSKDEALEMAHNIYDLCKNLIDNYELDAEETFIAIGLCEYSCMDRIGVLLAHTDGALAQAKFNQDNIYFEALESGAEVMGKEAWRGIIKEAIKTNNFSCVAYKTVDAKLSELSHNSLSLVLNVDEKTRYNYGQFMASVIQTGLSKEVYNCVMEKLIKNPDDTFKGSVVSLRLPYEYLTDKESYEFMHNLFDKHALKLPFKLIIEMPDKLVSENSQVIKHYKDIFEANKIDMGVFEFIGESTDYHYLQDLRPVYLKAEASYFLTQSDQSLSALRLITDTVGISLIAAGVMEKETLGKLEEKDIHVVQGRVTEDIKIS